MAKNQQKPSRKERMPPEEYAKRIAKEREYRRKQKERRLADPELDAAYRSKAQEYAAKRRKRIKARRKRSKRFDELCRQKSRTQHARWMEKLKATAPERYEAVRHRKSPNQKANSRRWYEKLKSDPERYLARAERCEEYDRKHKRRRVAMHRKSDKRRHKRIMADPVAHERRKAQMRANYHRRMQDPEYARKMKEKMKKHSAARYARLKADKEAWEAYIAETNLKNRARRDAMKCTPEGRAKLRETARRSAARLKRDPERLARRKEKTRAWFEEYKQSELYKERQRKKNELARKRRKKREENKRYREKNAERLRAYARQYRKEHPEAVRKSRMRDEEKQRTDPKFYAKRRAANRLSNMKRRTRKKPYKPSLSTRIPDWCVKGKVLSRNSPFLRNNMDETQRRSADAFAREKRIEEREYEEGHNLV